MPRQRRTNPVLTTNASPNGCATVSVSPDRLHGGFRGSANRRQTSEAYCPQRRLAAPRNQNRSRSASARPMADRSGGGQPKPYLCNRSTFHSGLHAMSGGRRFPYRRQRRRCGNRRPPIASLRLSDRAQKMPARRFRSKPGQTQDFGCRSFWVWKQSAHMP